LIQSPVNCCWIRLWGRVADELAMQAGLRAMEKKQLPHMLCITNMLLHGIEDPSFVEHDNSLTRPYASYGPLCQQS
jgi:type I restriction enzyme M protein